ncbi:MAG: O-antigen ligase family protein [Planctomycetota bacterium]
MSDAATSSARMRWDEALFWIVFTLHAFLPGRWQPAIVIADAPVMVMDLVLMALAVTLIIWRWRDLRIYPRPWLMVGVWFVVVVLWGVTSLPLWADARDTADAIGRLVPLLGASAAFVCAYVLMAGRPTEEIAAVLRRATIFLAVVGTAYAVKSLAAPGLELSFIRDAQQRARGPLFSPAVGHLALLPALGCAVGLALSAVGRQRTWWTIASCGLLLAVVAMGSRGALLGLAIFAALTALLVGGGNRIVRVAGIVALAGVGVLLVFGLELITGGRTRETSDPFRERTYTTAFAALSEAPTTVARGQGLGVMWPWYSEDAERSGWEGRDTDVAFWHHTPYGASMAHPHSLPLWLAVEFGLPGMLLVVSLLVCHLVVFRGTAGEPWRMATACGLSAAITAIAFDLPVFKSFTLATLWWMYLLGLLILHGRTSAKETAPCAA